MKTKDVRMSRKSVVLLSMFALACTSTPTCPSSDALRSQLAGLAPGQRLSVDGACTMTGSFVVPAGAILHGGNYTLTVSDTITLVPAPDDATPTTLEDVGITGGASTASVRIVGAGYASVVDIMLQTERGIGIGISRAVVTLDNLEMMGALDGAHAIEVPVPAPPESYATYGVAVTDGGHATVRTSTVSGFASGGVICVDAQVDLADTQLHENRGVGLAAFGCQVGASDLQVLGTISAPTLPGMGIALFDGSALVGTRVALRDAPGYGLFAHESAVTLTGPVVVRMQQAGVWVENGTQLVVTGGTFDENAGAAIAAIGVEIVDVHGTTFMGTTSAPIPSSGGAGTSSMADALHLVQLAGRATTIRLADLYLMNNARVGLLIDGGGEALALSVATTQIDTSGTELGAIAQHVASLPSSWDSGLSRVGSAVTLDPSAGTLVVSDGAGALGILMPPTVMF